jgi:hypothetical protein
MAYPATAFHAVSRRRAHDCAYTVSALARVLRLSESAGCFYADLHADSHADPYSGSHADLYTGSHADLYAGSRAYAGKYGCFNAERQADARDAGYGRGWPEH